MQNVTNGIKIEEIEFTEKCEGDLQGHAFTVDEAIEKAGYGKFQIRLTCLSGLGLSVNASEVIVLSIIGNYLACDWKLESWHLAVLTSLVFVGLISGAPVFGYIADKYGRKISFSASLLLTFIFGAVSAVSPSYEWLVSLRTLTGFAIAGTTQGATLCSEYCPPNIRGRAVFCLSYFWSIGSLCIILLTWAVMQSLGDWRILLALTAVPALLISLPLKWYPESPRYYLVSKQYLKATEMLQNVADVNGTNLPFGKLQEIDGNIEKGRFSDLFTKEYRRTTLLFWYTWFAVAFSYYGIVLLAPNIIQNGGLMMDENSDQFYNISKNYTENKDEVLECIKLSNNDYIDLAWTSSAELPGIIIFTFLVECCTRRLIIGGTSIIVSLLTFSLLLNTENHFRCKQKAKIRTVER